MEIILASKSPRRKEILSLLFDVKVITREVEENYDRSLSPDKVVEYLAKIKGQKVALENPDKMVVSSDTVVAYNGEIYGKPKSKEDAEDMLRLFSGKYHDVYTGYFVSMGGVTVNKSVLTRVKFRELTDSDIDWYISTGEPFDKAGSYGIQGVGNVLVESIDGDFYNVCGFPLSDFVAEIRKKFDISL